MNRSQTFASPDDKPSYGHGAETYTLEDFSDLVEEYDRFLAQSLSFREATNPDQSKTPSTMKTKLQQLEIENEQLKSQILNLTTLLTKSLSKDA